MDLVTLHLNHFEALAKSIKFSRQANTLKSSLTDPNLSAVEVVQRSIVADHLERRSSLLGGHVMELRYVKDVPCIITYRGKAETATPTADVVAQARQRIQDAQHMLASLEQSKAEVQTGLEAALLKGEIAAPYRAEISRITELASDQQHQISAATADIACVDRVLDHHKATQIRLADADALAALVKPFTDFLEKQQ